MANLLSAVLDPLKSAGNTAKGLMEIRDTTKFGGAVIELQAQILAAQQGALAAQAEQAALIKRVSQLEKERTSFETWKTEKQRYEHKELPPGVHVYTLKEDMASGEIPHHICKTCYERGKKSILDQSETNNGIYHLVCRECETNLKVGHFRAPRVDMGGDGGREGSWMR